MSRNVRQKPHYIDPELDDLEEAPLRPATPGAVSTAHLCYSNVAAVAPSSPRRSLADAWAAGDAHRASVQRKAQTDPAVAATWEDYIFGAHLGIAPPTEPGAAVQRKDNGTNPTDADVLAIAASGIEGSGQPLPHLDRIQAAFGTHDVSHIRAHIGGQAADAADAIGAEAYATGTDVAFQSSPDLHTAAHEAAHVIQQQQGVHLKGGVGQAGDTYEQHADAVADKVVRGESAEALLGSLRRAAPNVTIQMKPGGRHKQRSTAVADPKSVDDIKIRAQESALHFQAGAAYGALLRAKIDRVIAADAFQQQRHANFEKAAQAYDAAIKPSDLESFLTFMSSVAEMGAGAYGVYRGITSLAATIKNTKSAMADAKALSSLGYPTDSRGELLSGAKQAGAHAIETVKAGASTAKGTTGAVGVLQPESTDPTRALSTAIEDGVERADALLLAVATDGVKLDMQRLAEDGTFGLFKLETTFRGIQALVRGRQFIPMRDLEEILQLAANADANGKRFFDVMTECRQLWAAYLAGGRDALTQPGQRSVFDLVASWRRSGDPRVDKLHVASDEVRLQYDFEARAYTDGPENVGPVSWATYSCHAFLTTVEQRPSGRLFIPKQDKRYEELRQRMHGPNKLHGGRAQDAMSKVPAVKNSESLPCSPSLAKALAAAGVHAMAAHAEIALSFPAKGDIERMTGPNPEGAWFERWWETPTFISFWQNSLGGKFGFLYDKKKAHRVTFSAGAARQQKSTHVYTPHDDD